MWPPVGPYQVPYPSPSLCFLCYLLFKFLFVFFCKPPGGWRWLPDYEARGANGYEGVDNAGFKSTDSLTKRRLDAPTAVAANPGDYGGPALFH